MEVNFKMAKLIITTNNRKKYEVKGRVTFEAKLIENENGKQEIIISGKMTTHKYIEDIDKIETHRYLLTDVQVYKETFGSDDFDILYDFIAKDYNVKNGITNLSNTLIDSIEEKIYESDDSNMWEGDEQ